MEYEFIPPRSTQTSISEIGFKSMVECDTGSRRFHALTLVEGEKIAVECGEYIHPLNYLETIFIPAAAGKHSLINHSENECKVLLVKPQI